MSETVTLTSNAARRIKEILESEPSKRALRVAVNGGGCSGFQYEFALASGRNEDDVVVERDGATVVIDQTSLLYLGGSEIDFVDDLIGQSFKVKNPNATASCGCGTSFSI
jgi:iron-sulfur cluster insertion protein